MVEERKREDDVGAQKMNERVDWGIAMVQESADRFNPKMPMTEALFIKGIEVGISMFIQSEKR